MLRRILTYCTLPLLLLLSSGNSATTAAQEAPEGFNPGPDIITGDIGLFGGLEQFGSSGTQVGLAPSTTSCNAGDQVVNFFMLPDTTHPVIPHNLYRMSGGPGNDERFEQIGQGWPKHAFGADQASDCFTCQPGGNFSHLGVGCSDTYANFQNAEQGDLGSRALINPFTGEFQPTANNHSGHVHTGTSHRILVEGSDLNTTLNPGATYYAEVQYISSDEYAWCQSHAGQCNMYNNASYKRYNVSGTTSFTFAEVGNTVRMAAAVTAWPGATINPIEPAPGSDGRAYIAYKVTNPSAGVWHYEYAIYNENLDRAIQSFSLPSVLGGPGCGFSVANVGFHAPPNHPGFPNDGTQGGTGFSNTPWNFGPDPTGLGGFAWFTETMVQNPNANAIRWGTLYNFRFDSNKPPIAGNAIIGFFKTGEPVTVAIMSPNACDGVTPTPTPSATPSATPSPTATPSATVTPGASATPTATATPSVTPSPTAAAQPLNFSTRMLVQTGDNVGIGGFIIAGSSPKHVVVQAVGGLSVPGTLADPVLELHGPPGFVTITNDNCPGGQFPPPPPFCQPGSLNAAIDATLAPGAYTAIVKGKDNTSGVALVEVYDFNSAVDSKLANISTRAIVGTAENIVIAGFILGPNTGNGRILVRGIGPSLGNFGIANPLADPTLELRDNNGVLLAFNNDWQDPPIPPPIPPQLQPGNPLESVIVALLPPGAYTALLAGRNNGTGVGLIEVYDIGVP